MENINPDYKLKLDRVDAIFKGTAFVVNTRGRVDDKLQHTLKNIPQILRDNIYVVTIPEEVDSLTELLDSLNISVLGVLGVSHNFLGQVRQDILDEFKCNVVFIDDMFTFHAREHSDTGIETTYMLKQISEKNFTAEKRESIMIEMFEWVVEKLNLSCFGIVGISNRPSNNNIKFDEVYNDRIGGFYGVNYDLYKSLKNSPKFDDIVTKQDMYMILNFLTNGIPCVKSSKYAFNRSGGSNSKGGCSIYRNVQLMEHDAIELKNMFPNFVNLKDKPTTSFKNVGDIKSFKDVMVQWKKAYNGLPIEDLCGYHQSEAITKENTPNPYI
tara:strand:+ start:48911 stop:49888 length:978 start_codon:yes stop_codon:yes gene_type:complete